MQAAAATEPFEPATERDSDTDRTSKTREYRSPTVSGFLAGPDRTQASVDANYSPHEDRALAHAQRGPDLRLPPKFRGPAVDKFSVIIQIVCISFGCDDCQRSTISPEAYRFFENRH
jgi:hypothetical protein